MKLKHQSVVATHLQQSAVTAKKVVMAPSKTCAPVIQPQRTVISAPIPIADPYHCFSSCGWLFDDSQAPLWLLDQISTKPNSSCRTETLRDYYKSNKNNNVKSQQCAPVQSIVSSCPPDHAITSGAWLFDLSDVPEWFCNALSSSKNENNSTGNLNNVKRVYQKATTAKTSKSDSQSRPLPPVPNSNTRSIIAQTSGNKNNTEKPVVKQCPVISSQELFESGGWLFDSEMRPTWFESQDNSQITNKKSKAKNQTQHSNGNQNSTKIESTCLVKPVYDNAVWSWANPQQQWVRGTNWSMEQNCKQPRNQFTSNTQKQTLNHDTIPLQSQNSVGIGKYSLVKSNLCAPVECPRSTRVENFDVNGCSDYDMYAGVMRPNKTYLGRSKESKSGSKSKYTKPYY